MNITYIGHSGFMVQLSRTALLFDYYQGQIPELPRDQKLYIFASHRHEDHFSPQVFELAGRYLQVQYIFSRDIWKSRIPEQLRERTVSLKPRESHQDSDLWVETLRSTDEGVAFLVRSEGKVIYHAGDLNNWRWEGETKEWNRKMEENFKKFLEPIRGKDIDAAFVPLDPRQENDYALGLDYFLELTNAKKVYPMHCWEDYDVISRWRADHPGSPYQERIVTIRHRGEEFDQ